MDQYTVVLVEDEPIALQRLSQLIVDNAHLHLMAATSNVTDAIEALLQYEPDILITDLGLTDGSGVDILNAIEKHHLDTRAMVVSGFQDQHNVFQALEAGAQGYIHKHDKSQNIIDAIATMMSGGAPVSPVIARLMLQKFQRPPELEKAPLETLTESQTAILKLLSQGFSAEEIADKLGIGFDAVSSHIKQIYKKLRVNSRVEALREVERLDLF